MATLSQKVKNPKLDEALDALLDYYGIVYYPQIPDPAFIQPDPQNPVVVPLITNPVTKQATVEGTMESWIDSIVRSKRRKDADAAAKAALDTTTVIG